MGGPVGMMSAKIMLSAGALLFAGRVNMHYATAMLDPAVTLTQVSKPFAAKIHLSDANARNSREVGIDRVEVPAGPLALNRQDDADLVLGSNVLRDIPLLVDLDHGHLHVMDKREYRRATANMASVRIVQTSNGCFSLDVTDDGGRKMRAAFLSRPSASELSGTPTVITIGRLRLIGLKPSGEWRCASNDVALDWQSFAGHQILFDLAGKQIWVS